MSNAPTDLNIATIDIPDDIAAEEITISDLPSNWRQHPPTPRLADLGSDWAQSPGRSLILEVPSAVVVGENNVLINPIHPDIRRIEIVDVQPCALGERAKRCEK